MAKLKPTPLHVPRPTIIPGLGLPIKYTLILVGLIVGTAILFRTWKAWLILFCVWGVIGVSIRARLARDHNALRVDGIWLNTKAFFLEEDKWRGVTLRSFPAPRRTYRGIPS